MPPVNWRARARLPSPRHSDTRGDALFGFASRGAVDRRVGVCSRDGPNPRARLGRVSLAMRDATAPVDRRGLSSLDADESGSGFDLDLADLLDDHVRECAGDLSFAPFKARWIARSFSLAHRARLVEHLEGEHVQSLFSSALPHLAPLAGPLVRRVAALYALYLLYRTQQLVPPARVYVTPRQTSHLVALASQLKAAAAADALKAIREMFDDDAFVLGVSDAPREEALEDELARADARRAEEETETNDAAPREGNDDEENENENENDDDDDEVDTTAEELRARVRAASRAALEHLRRTRVPESFARLSEDSARYGDAVRPVMRARRAGAGAGVASSAPRRAPTTTEMHELVRRQLVKYDGKLRAALRPESASAPAPRGMTAAEAAAAALAADEDDSDGDLAHLGFGFTRGDDAEANARNTTRTTKTMTKTMTMTNAAALPAAGARRLVDAPKFGSMPKFPGAPREDEGVVAGARSRLGGATGAVGRLDDSDDEGSDGEGAYS